MTYLKNSSGVTFKAFKTFVSFANVMFAPAYKWQVITPATAGKDVIKGVSYSNNATLEPKTIHDLGAASPFPSVSFIYNPKTKGFDCKLTFNISTNKLLGLAWKNSLEAANPGLAKEVGTHEESHVDQFFEAAISKPVSVTRNGKKYTGNPDKVFTDVINDFESSLKKEVDGKKFKTVAEANKYADDKRKEFNNGEGQKIVENISKQINNNILEKYDKSKQTPAQIQAIENDANDRTIKKIGSKAQYLNNKKTVMYKGKALPPN